MKKVLTCVLCIFIITSIIFSQDFGDVNNDSAVDIVDALLVAQYYVGLNPPALTDLPASDVNCDDVTDIVDALLIAQYYVGLVTEFPCSPTGEPTQSPVPDPTQTPGPTPSPTPGLADGLSVLYKNRETDPAGTWIMPVIKIKNDGSASVAMDELTIRYWYTNEAGTTDSQVAQINWSAIESDSLVITFHDMEPLPAADTYMEIGFTTGAGELLPGTDCGDIDMGIHDAEWTTYDQSDDHSFGLNTDHIIYDRITLYRNGALVWGDEPNLIPVPDFDWIRSTPIVNETVTFNGALSYDPDGSIDAYAWEFGDGSQSTGMSTTHTYSASGDYSVTLTVTDNEGIRDSITKIVTIYTGDPVALFTMTPEYPKPGDTITFDAAQAFDPDGSLTSCSWDFGDGAAGTGTVTTHSYSIAMVYEVTLTVTDDQGKTGSMTQICNVATIHGALLIASADNPHYPFWGEGCGVNIGLWTNKNHWYPIENRDPRLENIAKEAGVKLIRFPAGNESDKAAFDRTNSTQWYVGPASPYERTMRADFIDAIADFAEYLGADIMITVNAKIDDPDMAADVVRYCNVDNNYNVKFFEIGNEPSLYDDDTTPESFAQRVERYASAMKAVDPDIIITGPNAHQPTHQDTFVRPFLEAGGNTVIDSISQHLYALWGSQTDIYHPVYPTVDNLLRYEFIPYEAGGNYYGDSKWHWKASITGIDRMMDTWEHSLLKLKNEYCTPSTTIGITELGPSTGGGNISGMYASALWYAEVLGRFPYNQCDYLTMFLLSGNQEYSMVDLDYNIQPLWYAFVMYQRYFGDMMVTTLSDQPEDITLWASAKQNEPDTLYLMTINRHQTDALPATIYTAGFTPTSAVKFEMNGPSLEALSSTTINGVEADASFVIPDIPGDPVDVIDRAITVTLPAHSVTAFVLTGMFIKQ